MDENRDIQIKEVIVDKINSRLVDEEVARVTMEFVAFCSTINLLLINTERIRTVIMERITRTVNEQDVIIDLLIDISMSLSIKGIDVDKLSLVMISVVKEIFPIRR